MEPDSNWLQDRLKSGESVAAFYQARDGTSWYATTGRVVKYQRDRFAERSVEVLLDDIQDIRFQKCTNVRMMGFGALLIFLGLIFLFLSLFPGFFPFAVFAIFIGGGLFAYGYLKDTYLYQFQGDQLDEEEWQLPDSTKSARYFIQTIRKLKGLKD